MKLNFAIICEHAFIDKEERLSIIQTFNIIKSLNFPTSHPRLTIVTNYSPENKDINEKQFQLVSIFNPDGTRIAEISLEFVGTKTEAQTISYFYNLPLNQEGKYIIKIDLNEKLVKELSLDVNKTT